jgi:hypothetical protein
MYEGLVVLPDLSPGQYQESVCVQCVCVSGHASHIGLDGGGMGGGGWEE